MQPTTPPMPPPVADRAGEWPVYILALLVGLSIGSFLNVCIHRLPAEQSLVWPGSRCPRCASPIAWYDNVPIVSWLRLGGRCRACHAPISVRYPVIELLTGGLALLSLARFGATPWAVVAFAFACALVVVSVIDLEHGIIPDVISLPGILVGLAVSALVPGGVGLWNAFAGAVLGGGLLWAIAAGYQRAAGIEGLGLGDVKLLAMIGAFLGWQSLPAVLLVASITGKPRRDRRHREPPWPHACAPGAARARTRRPRAPPAPHAAALRSVPRARRPRSPVRSVARASLELGRERLTRSFAAFTPPRCSALASPRCTGGVHADQDPGIQPARAGGGLALLSTIAGAGALRLPDVLDEPAARAARRNGSRPRCARRAAARSSAAARSRSSSTGARARWELRDANGAIAGARGPPAPASASRACPASGRVRFNALGTTDNATVTLRGGASLRRIVVNQRGRVRVQ